MEGKTKRIFLVEADALVAFEIKDTLKDLGFEVMGPSMRLNNAIHVAQHDEFDIGFLEVNLGPGQTTEPVAAILRGRKIPYAFLTAHDSGRIKFLRKNDLMIYKPASPRDLIDAVQQLDGQRP